MGFSFNESQISVIKRATDKISIDVLENLFGSESFNALQDKQQLVVLMIANTLYRAGHPAVSDAQYDQWYAVFAKNNPDHPFVKSVEPEPVEGKTVALPKKMLSTDKAYTREEIEKWLDRIIAAADELGISHKDIQIRVTPKLDGYAAFDDGETLYTRGDGLKGQDISRAFKRGLVVANGGERGLEAGEIVINKQYFEENLSEHFENTRNIQAAIIAEKNVDERVQKALDDGACVFFPFALINNWTGHYTDLINNFESVIESVWNSTSYDVDGVVIESNDPRIKEHMGATRKFHRWQIAFKVNDQMAEVEVLDIVPQTSRTGRVSPVAELVPTKLSGATLSRATAHHYAMVKQNGLGKGAVVQLVRSGLVIPKIEKVIKKVEPKLPTECPSCGAGLIWEGDHLYCTNTTNCPAQTENTIIHFFKTIGTVDGFGPKVVEKIVAAGISRISEVYSLTSPQLTAMGFGEKTSENLINQLKASLSIEIEDWRFLAAFGIHRLGRGSSERVLSHHHITDLFGLSVNDFASIDGFAETSAEIIVEGLSRVKSEFDALYSLGFNMTETKGEAGATDSPITGTTIVFTGTMVQGSRSDMEKQAKSLGATVGKSVTGKTTYLVAGDKVGETKINAARSKGVKVLTEQEYLDLIAA
ncbi:BRCT domain-containing protein [Vibrio fluvialis]